MALAAVREVRLGGERRCRSHVFKLCKRTKRASRAPSECWLNLKVSCYDLPDESEARCPNLIDILALLSRTLSAANFSNRVCSMNRSRFPRAVYRSSGDTRMLLWTTPGYILHHVHLTSHTVDSHRSIRDHVGLLLVRIATPHVRSASGWGRLKETTFFWPQGSGPMLPKLPRVCGAPLPHLPVAIALNLVAMLQGDTYQRARPRQWYPSAPLSTTLWMEQRTL